MLIFVKKLEPGVINKIKYKHNTAAKPYSIFMPLSDIHPFFL
jgi:hypothetical protein